MDLPIAQYAPDLPPLSPGFSRSISNVVSESPNSYAPMRQLQAFTDALTARCQGFASMRATNGTVKTFAGDATKLYSKSGQAWDDASRLAGGAYTIASDDFWYFVKFGSLAIAVNGADAPQKFNIASDTDFSALGGSPPTPKFATVWGDYVVFLNLTTANNKLQWSGTDNAESWTVGVGNSDERTFPDGGEIVGATGGRQKLVFQENAIRIATEVGGTDIFQFDTISTDRGCAASGSIASYQDLVFFVAPDGFFMLSDAGLRAIGEQRVDNTFWDDVNRDFLYRITAICDPRHKTYRISYPSNASGDGTPDKMLIYNWATDRWTPAVYDIEFLGRVLTNSGVTLEDLDALYPGGIETIPISFDSPAFASTPEESLAAFDTAHKLGYFDGAVLAATIDSIEDQIIPGAKAKIIQVRPIIEGGSAASIKVSLGVRNNKLNDTQRFTAQVTQRTRGHCPFATKRTKARYHMARTDIAAGTEWANYQGWDFKAVPAGAR